MQSLENLKDALSILLLKADAIINNPNFTPFLRIFYLGLAEKETKRKVVGKEEEDNTLTVY